MENMDNKDEFWIQVVGYEGLYEISTLGNIKSIDRKLLCKNNTMVTKRGVNIVPKLNEKGYLRAGLSKNNKSKQFRVHRLVAKHFILNPLDLPEVNHIDGNKLNNCVDNLEWSTRQYNMDHAYKTGLCGNCAHFGSNNHKSRKVINNSTKIIYESVTAAAKSINMKTATLNAMLTGVNKNHTLLSYYTESSDELVVNHKMN